MSWFTWWMHKGTQKERLLSVLSDGMWHLHKELCSKVGLRYSARIYDARQEGKTIATRQIKKGLYAYKLINN